MSSHSRRQVIPYKNSYPKVLIRNPTKQSDIGMS